MTANALSLGFSSRVLPNSALFRERASFYTFDHARLNMYCTSLFDSFAEVAYVYDSFDSIEGVLLIGPQAGASNVAVDVTAPAQDAVSLERSYETFATDGSPAQASAKGDDGSANKNAWREFFYADFGFNSCW